MPDSPQKGANIVKSQAWDETGTFLPQNRSELVEKNPQKAEI